MVLPVDQTVEVPVGVLDTIAARLAERRVHIEKEVLKYGEAPAGIKEVFELCRGFERAYVNFVNESPVAGKVKESFMGEKGLAGVVRKHPMEKIFDLSNVKAVCRYADGYQPHLLSPEKGMRALGMEAMDQITGYITACVQQVYNLLLNAAREAAEKAGQFTESALMGSMPMYVPDFKNVVMPAIIVAMDEWKADAEKMALMLVDMERSYITAGFFRHTMYTRFDRIKQQQALMMAANNGGIQVPKEQQPTGVMGQMGQAATKAKNFFPAFGKHDEAPPAGSAPSAAGMHSPPVGPAKSAPPGVSPAVAKGEKAAEKDGEDSDGSADGTPPSKQSTSGSTGFGQGSINDPNDFVAAYFDKCQSDESAFSSLTGWKWQKRFFICSDSQRMLYYFKTPEDVPKPNGLRGQVNIAECVVEDLDDKGNVRQPGQQYSGTDKSQLMIRLRHKDPRQFAVKDHNAIILRAESVQQKLEWLARLQKAAERLKPKPAPAAKGAGGSEGGSESKPSGSAPHNLGDDLAWARDMEPILDTHLGQGSRMFRGDNIRLPDGKLLPAPSILLNPIRMVEMLARGGNNPNTFEIRYEALLEQFGADMLVYTRMVCDTLITTVPKSIVHCMIRKSEKNLLERLFTVIHRLTPAQMESLLKEEDAVIARRAEARSALEDAKTCIFQVQQALERYNMTAPAERKDKVALPCQVFAYSGSAEYLDADQKAYYDKRFSGEYAPDTMRYWMTPPTPRMMLPASAQRQPAPASSQQQAPPPQQGGPPQPGLPPSQSMRVPSAAPMAPPPHMVHAGTMLRPGGPPPPVPNRPAPSAPSATGMGQPMRRPAPPPPGK